MALTSAFSSAGSTRSPARPLARSLSQSPGAVLAFGSDAPVESPNPFWGLHAAVTRQRPDGSPGPHSGLLVVDMPVRKPQRIRVEIR